MASAREHDDSSVNERSPFVIIESVLATVVTLNKDIPDADAAWAKYVATKGREQREYLLTIRRSGHSVFYDMHQELYEFGMSVTNTPSQFFCPAAGATFMRLYFVENIHPFLKVALAAPRDFQATIVDMLGAYLQRYAARRYDLAHAIHEDAIELTLTSRNAQATSALLAERGLDADRCFLNSLGFIFGAFNAFLAQVVEGYDERASSRDADGQRGHMRFPVRAGSTFTYQSLITTLVGYTNELLKRQRRAADEERLEHDLIIGSSAMRRTWDRIGKAGRSHEIVLLRGESGTGKSFIARKIHGMSPRASGPFVEVGLTSDIGSDNMIQSDLFGHRKGAFTGATEHKQGLFQLADGGTIFLDEIGDASAELQAKLLRVLETSTFRRLGDTTDITVDVRVIVATNRDLEEMTQKGSFRQDLYYRINVIPIELPALRKRPDDIPALAEFLLARSARGERRPAIGPGLAGRLQSYSWPGNIRELDHALKHAAAMCEGDEIRIEDFPAPVREHLGGAIDAAASGAGRESGVAGASTVVDVDALRAAIVATDAAVLDATQRTFAFPAHVDHAKRLYLAALIDVLGGDLTNMARFWDRSSPKSLRKLVIEYGLTEELARARERGPHQTRD